MEYGIDRRRWDCDQEKGETKLYHVYTHYVDHICTSSIYQNTPSRVFHSLPVSSTFQFHSSQRIYHFHSNHCKSPLPFSFSPSPMSTSPTTSAQSDLDLSSLVNQLSASTDFNDLRQKMTKIENSKVLPLPNPTHPLDEGLCRPPQTPTRTAREKGILSPYSSPT